MVEQALQALPDLQELAQARRGRDTECVCGKCAFESRSPENVRGGMGGAAGKSGGGSGNAGGQTRARSGGRLGAGGADHGATAADAGQSGITHGIFGVEGQNERRSSGKARGHTNRARRRRQRRSKPNKRNLRSSRRRKRQGGHAGQTCEKLRKQQEARARFEELRELCGWREVEWPPGWEET